MMKQYTPSELANLTGVTPRTIRYYDQRGLLKPESRNAEGYRLYGGDALLRMQRITMLKFAGFSLGEIRDALEVTEQENLWQLLSDQKQLITQRIEQLEEIVNLLDELSQADASDPDTLARSMQLVRKINHSGRMYQVFQRNGSANLYPWEFDRMQLKPGERILDAGCGVGMIWRHSWERIPKSLQVDLMDLHENNLTKLQTYYRERKELLAPGVRLSFRHENVETAALDGGYDQILMAYLFHSLERCTETVEKLKMMLRPGGILNVVESVDVQMLEEMDALYQEFSGIGCLENRIESKKKQRKELEQMLNACFPKIECHVFQNDLTFTVVEELYRYLMDSYRELVQELEASGTDFIAYLRKVMAQKGKIVFHSQVRMYRCKKEEA